MFAPRTARALRALLQIDKQRQIGPRSLRDCNFLLSSILPRMSVLRDNATNEAQEKRAGDREIEDGLLVVGRTAEQIRLD